ncbi:MAG TPA: BolA/IbaG family iron-sulfur metabolism protein [Planctomycetota bacterium]|nr:BolA/IbaG family iron-sulfur metabolism protein [Planctomycetota bacterium]
MPLTTTQLEALLRRAFPAAASIRVTDLTGTSDHFGVEVVAADFAGKSLVQQHKLVHAACAEHLGGAIHALQIKTRSP